MRSPRSPTPGVAHAVGKAIGFEEAQIIVSDTDQPRATILYAQTPDRGLDDHDLLRRDTRVLGQAASALAAVANLGRDTQPAELVELPSLNTGIEVLARGAAQPYESAVPGAEA